jgi:Zc3h12a-like Ribonuclease NYN domain
MMLPVRLNRRGDARFPCIGGHQDICYPYPMIVPVILLLFSLAGIAAALTQPGLSDLILLAAPCALASLFLLVRAYSRRAEVSSKPKQKMIVIDGSNVMHWKDGTPQISALREVVQHLTTLGYTPGVVFDANAGHLMTGKYQHHGAMSKLLGLPEDRVMVVNKGTPADPTILAAARDLDARIVTNDRYKDWADTHPEVREPGHLIRGEFRAGKLSLDFGEGKQ